MLGRRKDSGLSEEGGVAEAKLSGSVGGVLDEGGAIEVFSYGVSASDPGTGLGKSLAVGKYGDRSS